MTPEETRQALRDTKAEIDALVAADRTSKRYFIPAYRYLRRGMLDAATAALAEGKTHLALPDPAP